MWVRSSWSRSRALAFLPCPRYPGPVLEDKPRQLMRPSLQRLKRLFLRLQTGWSILGVTLVLIALLELGLEGLFWLKDRSKPRIPPDPRVISAVPEGSAWLDRHYRELEA